MDVEPNPATAAANGASSKHVPGLSALDALAFREQALIDLGLDEEDFSVLHWKLAEWTMLSDCVVSPEFHCAGWRFRMLLFPRGNLPTGAAPEPEPEPGSGPGSESGPGPGPGPAEAQFVSLYLECADLSAPAQTHPAAGFQEHGPEAAVALTPAGPGRLPLRGGGGWRRTAPARPDHACVQFALTMSNLVDPTVLTTQMGCHRFTVQEADWGFTQFAPLAPLVEKGIIERGAVRVSACVRVVRDKTGVLWHNMKEYDSKGTTGYVGLHNQGATCYMNSLLQSLYCTPAFRRAVYAIPTEADSPGESVALALQRLFHGLQTSTEPVNTTELTRSFGWKSLDSFYQHDVQEFNRVLLDKLEDKMKGTAADGCIARLFRGRMKSYIRCLDVDYESSRTEEFYDIQLNVKGNRTLLDSFRDYVQVERLDGDNQYRAEGYGLQDATKGVIFESLPPVLHLQLKRFEYDLQHGAMVKINDRHEFPLEIDLAEFVERDSTTTAAVTAYANGDAGLRHVNDWTYRLHGVLVHSGDPTCGHYIALLKPAPEPSGGWFRFDDDRVTPALVQEVLEDNFGGEVRVRSQPQPEHMRHKGISLDRQRITNAYMLVYVRTSEAGSVLHALEPHDTPAHLSQRLVEEQQARETQLREREELHRSITCRLITFAGLYKYQGLDLAAAAATTSAVSDRSETARGTAPTLAGTWAKRVGKHTRFATLKAQLAEELGLRPDELRAWVLIQRQNMTVRPDTVVEDEEMTVEEVRVRYAVRSEELNLLLEPETGVPRDALGGGARARGFSMVLLKHFDVLRQTLFVVGQAYVRADERVSELVGRVRRLMKWPASRPIGLYEEIRPGMIEAMDPAQTFAESEIVSGDIICFQCALPERTAAELEARGMCSKAPSFYDFITHRISVICKAHPTTTVRDGEGAMDFAAPDSYPSCSHSRSRSNNSEGDQTTQQPVVTLTVHRELPYDALAKRVAAVLGIDPTRLRLTLATVRGGGEADEVVLHHVLRSDKPNPLLLAVSAGCSGSGSGSGVLGVQAVLYYEQLDVPLTLLESQRAITVRWMGMHNREESVLALRRPKSMSIAALQRELAETQLEGGRPRNAVLVGARGSDDGGEGSDGDGGGGSVALVAVEPDSIACNLPRATRVRLSLVSDGGPHDPVPLGPGTTLAALVDGDELLAEEVPGEELEVVYARAVGGAGPGHGHGHGAAVAVVVVVRQFARDERRGPGVPFRMVLRAGETLAGLRRRVQARLGASHAEMGRMRIARITVVAGAGADAARPEYLLPDSRPFDVVDPARHALGLDRAPGAGRTLCPVGMPRAIGGAGAGDRGGGGGGDRAGGGVRIGQ